MLAASRLRVALVLGLTFAAGITGGVALDRRVFSAPRARATATDARADSAQRGGHHAPVIERFATELELTPDQRGRIESILDSSRVRMRAVWEDVRPRYSAIIDSTRMRIEDVLTPEQVQQYRTLLRQQYQRRDGDSTRGPDRDSTGRPH